MISTTKNHVILDKPSYADLVRRANRAERIGRELRERLREANDLLNAALNELGRERGAKDLQHFARQWRTGRRA